MEKINSLSLDLETFSDVDLNKCGVYKYAQSSAFEILLFGVSVNGGEVQVYDLAQGESVLAEIIKALTDNSVLKWAFNASFERVCLSVWLQKHYPQYFESYSIHEDNIVKFWWEVDRCVKETVKKRVPTETHGIRLIYQSGMLFIKLPSGRQLSYVKPRMGENRFGGEAVTYEGVRGTKKWERIESYGPKFVENIVQAISRDILMYAMKTLSHCFICGHVHDELIIECGKEVSVDAICEQMGRTPLWITGLLLRADGYECEFYKKIKYQFLKPGFLSFHS